MTLQKNDLALARHELHPTLLAYYIRHATLALHSKQYTIPRLKHYFWLTNLHIYYQTNTINPILPLGLLGSIRN